MIACIIDSTRDLNEMLHKSDVAFVKLANMNAICSPNDRKMSKTEIISKNLRSYNCIVRLVTIFQIRTISENGKIDHVRKNLLLILYIGKYYNIKDVEDGGLYEILLHRNPQDR